MQEGTKLAINVHCTYTTPNLTDQNKTERRKKKVETKEAREMARNTKAVEKAIAKEIQDILTKVIFLCSALSLSLSMFFIYKFELN